MLKTCTKESDAETKVIRKIFANTVEETNEVEALLTKLKHYRPVEDVKNLFLDGKITFNCRNPNQKRCGPLTTSEISSQ